LSSPSRSSSLTFNTSKNLTAVRRELVALSASFPESVQPLIAAAKSVDAMEALAERLASRKLPPTLVEMNTVLDQAVLATAKMSLASTRESYVQAKCKVGAEFAVHFELYESKVVRMEKAMDTFIKRAKDIVPEITVWKFEECSFVKLPKDKPDLEIVDAARCLESSWGNFENYANTAEQLFSKQTHMPHMIKQKAIDIYKKFESSQYAGGLKTARVLLAHCGLASAIWNSKGAEDQSTWPLVAQPMLIHFKTKLGIIPEEHLDAEFAAKLGIGIKHAVKTAAKGKPGGKRPSVGSDASTAAPPSSAGSVASGIPESALPELPDKTSKKSAVPFKFRRRS
jgi:hypothetical protein